MSFCAILFVNRIDSKEKIVKTIHSFNRVEGHAYNDTVDQWCLGILCYEFLVGRPPFESPDSENTYAKIRRLEIDYPSYLSIGAKDLIAGVS